MCIKWMMGVDLINELFRKSGGEGGGRLVQGGKFKPVNEFDINNNLFKRY